MTYQQLYHSFFHATRDLLDVTVWLMKQEQDDKRNSVIHYLAVVEKHVAYHYRVLRIITKKMRN